MKAKLLEHSKGAELFALIFETGDEVTSGILNFAREHHLSAAHFSGIGAFQKAVLGYFDWEKKEYLRIPIDEQVEVVSLVGDIALEKEEPKLHAHVGIARRDASAQGGHLLEAHVRPTLEVMLEVSPARLQKYFDPASGLALIRI